MNRNEGEEGPHCLGIAWDSIAKRLPARWLDFVRLRAALSFHVGLWFCLELWQRSNPLGLLGEIFDEMQTQAIS